MGAPVPKILVSFGLAVGDRCSRLGVAARHRSTARLFAHTWLPCLTVAFAVLLSSRQWTVSRQRVP